MIETINKLVRTQRSLVQELGFESPAVVRAKLEELERQGKTAFLAAFQGRVRGVVAVAGPSLGASPMHHIQKE